MRRHIYLLAAFALTWATPAFADELPGTSSPWVWLAVQVPLAAAVAGGVKWLLPKLAEFIKQHDERWMKMLEDQRTHQDTQNAAWHQVVREWNNAEDLRTKATTDALHSMSVLIQRVVLREGTTP